MILSAVRPTAAMSEVSAADCFSLSAAGKGVSSLHRLTLIVQAWRDVSISRCQAFLLVPAEATAHCAPRASTANSRRSVREES
jgi:hypothetical protein